MSLQKRLTFVVSIIVTSMLAVIVYFSWNTADDLFAAERLINIAPLSSLKEKTDTSEKKSLIDSQLVEVKKNIVNSKRLFNMRLLMILVVLSIIGILFTYFFVGKSLKSLIKLQKKIDQIDSSVLGEKIIIEKKQPREVQKLTQSFNKMNQRLSDFFINQKLFLDNAAHEFRTPLTVVNTYAQLLEMEQKNYSHEDQEIIQTILANTNRLEAILTQLLYLSNSDSLALDDVLDSRQLIDDVLNELLPLAEKRAICLENKNQEPYEFKGNSLMLHLALKNLIENAIKYGEPNTSVMINAQNHVDSLLIVVKNKGKEIPLEERKHIFDPFYRNKDIDVKVEGSGLGLALVKNIIEKHGGKVRCDFQKDEVIFSFWIPKSI